MRFATFTCAPYGPFEALTLEFPLRDGDLQIIYGPNEAGKSTLLRAIEGFLYRIPGQTKDNHTHENKVLSIGARLTLGDGGLVGARRRKGNKDTLLPWGDGCLPLVESHLEALLEQIATPEQFRQLFGLTHAQMTAGSEVILKTAGDLGVSLASAGLGGRFREVQQSLDAEYEELFKRGAHKQRLPRLMKELEQVRAELAAASINPGDWQQREADEAAAEATRSRCTEALRELGLREKSTALRLQVIPLLLDLDLLEAEMLPLGEVPLLPEGFTAERIGAQKDLLAGEAEVEELTETLGRLDVQLSSLPQVFPLLKGELPVRIEGLNRRIGEFRSSSKDLPDRKTELLGLQKHEATLRQRLPEALRAQGTMPDVALQAHVQSLIEAEARLERVLATTRESLRLAERDAVKASDALGSIAEAPSRDALADALKRSEEARDLESRLQQHRNAIGDLRDAWEAPFRQLRFVTEPIEGFVERGLPLEATIQQAIADGRILTDEQREIAHRLSDLDEDIAIQETALATLLRAGHIPTLAEMEAARAHRDAGWQQVRAVWLDAADRSVAEAEWSDGTPLPEAYESAVTGADVAADALRSDAEAVEKRRFIEDQLEQQRTRHQLLRDRQEQLHLGERAAAAAWVALWEPLAFTPGSPEEMLEWRRGALAIQQQWQQWRRASQEIREFGASLEIHRDALADAVRSSGGQVAEFDGLKALRTEAQRLIDEATTITTRAEERQRQLSAAQEALARASEQQQQAEAERAEWQIAWDATLTKLGLPVGESTAGVRAVLECYRDIATNDTEFQRLLDRSAKIERDIRAFETDVDALLADLALPSRSQPADIALAAIHEQLGREGEQQRKSEDILERREELSERLQSAERRVKQATTSLQRLLSVAGVATAAELPAREDAAARRRDLERQRDEAQRQLHRAGGGRPLSELRELCAAVDEATLQQEQEELAEAREQIAAERDDAIAAARSARDARLHLEAQSGAADLCAREAMLRSELREVAGDYMRLRLASALLESSIDTLRQSGDSPVLQRASHWFARLTNGDFAGICLEGAGDRQEIRGLRTPDDETPIAPEAMSDGTRDQLYLGLRLAIVEQYCLHHEPLPMILDDLLITFDDARTAATLAALAEFSAVTQVLLFTHHHGVCDAAEAIGLPVPREVLILAK